MWYGARFGLCVPVEAPQLHGPKTILTYQTTVKVSANGKHPPLSPFPRKTSLALSTTAFCTDLSCDEGPAAVSQGPYHVCGMCSSGSPPVCIPHLKDDAKLFLMDTIHRHLEGRRASVRLLFVDFSSAFNIMQSAILARPCLTVQSRPRPQRVYANGKTRYSLALVHHGVYGHLFYSLHQCLSVAIPTSIL